MYTKPEVACGKPAESFIPRWGMSFACVLEKGHEGDCKGGGDCVVCGPHVGIGCPNFPKCYYQALEKEYGLEPGSLEKKYANVQK